MFDAIIPLRSGSKGIKDKNLIKFQGELLVNFTLKKILKIKEIRKIFILTDSIAYKKKILKHKKIDLSYIRPNKLSKDNSKINDLIYNFIKWSEGKFDINRVLFFQVTNPLISLNEINKSVSFIKKKKIESLIHVSEMLEPPYECVNKLGKNWKLLSKKQITNRQNFKKFFFITGSMYFFTKKFFLKYKKMYNSKSYAYEVDKINFVDINTSFDYEIAKLLYKKKYRN
tara:strand:- start:2652 stop:3335 length:684 start_codon:yes stop_codon:yes gene_type:complete